MDIVELHELLQKQVLEVEQGHKNPKLLEQIESEFIEFAEMIKLFLISERDTYYGYIMMNLHFKVDFGSKSVAGIVLNEYPYVFATNPNLLCKYSIREIMYIFCHEIDHIIFNHPSEMVKSNPEKKPKLYELFNIAADAAVNDNINFEIKNKKRTYLQAPDGIITSSYINDLIKEKNFKGRAFSNQSYLYYYDILMQITQDDADEDEQYDSNQNEGTSDDIVTWQNVGEIEDHNWKESDTEAVEEAVKELLNSADEMMNDEIRGTMPETYQEAIRRINEPAKITWEKVLKKYIGTITAGTQKSRMRLNRRQPNRFDLSGVVENKILKIVVAIDTSGSMSNEMIAQCINEVMAIVAKRKCDVTVIECDADVQKVYKVRNKNDIQNKVDGRGGTLFTPVIEYLNDNRYYRDALLIYFTDGYGENSIPKPKTYRNIWVLVNSNILSLKEPYGEVIEM